MLGLWSGGMCYRIDPIHKAGVQPLDEHSDEGHLFSGVLKDDPGVVRLAAQTVRSHHHGQVVDVHLGDSHIGRLSKDLYQQDTRGIRLSRSETGKLFPGQSLHFTLKKSRRTFDKSQDHTQ